MSRGLVVTWPLPEVENSPHNGHADAARSAVTTWMTRPPTPSVATSRIANPARPNSCNTADTTGATPPEPT